ncbi:MAG: winged helix-turn-helix transcriptional regulator [Chloroflexi bacterium]|nr:winged helix-turn-helix transcriptional regulator [Chloroflexota bacterium]
MALATIETDRLATMLKALGHPARIEIVRLMAEAGDANCVELTHHVSLAQSTVSEHLRVLKEAGLIQQCAPGARSGYCLSREALIWLKQSIVAL